MNTVTDTLLTIVRAEGVEQYVRAFGQTIPGAMGKASAAQSEWGAAQQLNIDRMQAQATAYGRQATIVAGMTATILGLAGAGIKAAADMQGLQVRFETLTGSAAKAQQLASFVKNLPMPFSLSEVGEAAGKIELFGQNAQKWLPMAGDMAAGAHKSVVEAAGAIAQVLSGSPIGIRRLRQFGIMSEQLQAAGWTGSMKTPQDLATLAPALQSVIDAKFSGGTERALNTLGGATANMRREISLALEVIGQGFTPTLTGAAKETAVLAHWFQNLSPHAKEVANDILKVGIVGGTIASVTLKAAQMALQWQTMVAQRAMAARALAEETAQLEANTGAAEANAAANGVAAGAAGSRGAAGFMGRGMGATGAIMAATAGAGIGYVGGSMLTGASTGWGMAGMAGTVLAGAGAGAAVGGPAGAVVGAFTAVAGAGYKLVASLNDMVAKSAQAADDAENKFSLSFVPVGAGLTRENARGIAGSRFGNEGGSRGWYVPTSAMTGMSAQQAASMGLVRDSRGLFRTETDVERDWSQWKAENLVPVRASEKGGGTAPTLAGLAAAAELATSQAAITDSVRRATDAANEQGLSFAELQQRQIALTDTLKWAGDQWETLNRKEDDGQQAQYAYADATKAATKAIEEQAAAAQRVSEAMTAAQSSSEGYAGVLKALGVGDNSVLYRNALGYQRNVGYMAAQRGLAAGDTGAYYGGLTSMLGAEKGLAGAAANYGGGWASIRGQDVIAPWQWQAAQQNGAAGAQINVVAQFQTPKGLISAFSRDVRTDIAAQQYNEQAGW